MIIVCNCAPDRDSFSASLFYGLLNLEYTMYRSSMVDRRYVSQFEKLCNTDFSCFALPFVSGSVQSHPFCLPAHASSLIKHFIQSPKTKDSKPGASFLFGLYISAPIYLILHYSVFLGLCMAGPSIYFCIREFFSSGKLTDPKAGLCPHCLGPFSMRSSCCTQTASAIAVSTIVRREVDTPA